MRRIARTALLCAFAGQGCILLGPNEAGVRLAPQDLAKGEPPPRCFHLAKGAHAVLHADSIEDLTQRQQLRFIATVWPARAELEGEVHMRTTCHDQSLGPWAEADVDRGPEPQQWTFSIEWSELCGELLPAAEPLRVSVRMSRLCVDSICESMTFSMTYKDPSAPVWLVVSDDTPGKPW